MRQRIDCDIIPSTLAADVKGLDDCPGGLRHDGRQARKQKGDQRGDEQVGDYFFFGGLIMMCAPAVPGDISQGAPSLDLVDNPVDCGVA